MSGKRGSNSRPQPWQGCALPTELFPRYFVTRHFRRHSLCESELSHSLARKFRITLLFTNTKLIISLIVKEMRLELTRPNGHYPLKVARLPIPPLLHNYAKQHYSVPRTGLEPARLSTLAPETSASTNSAIWASSRLRAA